MKKKKFIKLYDKYANDIFRFIYFKISSREKAQDLASEVFLRFWRLIKIKNQELRIKNKRAFLYKIARNLVIDYYRKKSSKEVPLKDEIAEILPGKSDLQKSAEISSDIEQMLKALKSIKHEYQEAVVLYYIDDMKIKEISRILDKTENNVRVLVHRGLEALRKKL
tara:strand:+ start:948 stop:1445 length:498 start_codon:yes stop_codon:yes gene_type:complete